MQKHNLLDTFQPRTRAIVTRATEGWGHKDSLADAVYTYYDE